MNGKVYILVLILIYKVCSKNSFGLLGITYTNQYVSKALGGEKWLILLRNVLNAVL